MANHTETAPTSQNGATGAEQTARPVRRPRQNMKMWSIVTKARNKFNGQVMKNNETKLMCLKAFLASHQDSEKFWAEYMEQANRLLDSKRFDSDCRRLAVHAEIVATHVVFLGNTAVNNTLKSGVEAVVGNQLKLYKERFLPETAEKYSIENVKCLPAPEVSVQ